MGSFFKNWNTINPTKPAIDSRANDRVEVNFGQVLEVYYDNPTALGAIKVKIYGVNDKSTEDNIVTTAEPADRNIVKYPVPGEIVLLSIGLNDYHSEGKTAKTYYYRSVLSTSGNVTYNGNPYYLNRLNKNEVEKQELKNRFEKAMFSRDAFFSGTSVNGRTILQPYEGDFIIQSRWGSGIRFGSSGFKDENAWSSKSSLSGDPILMITANSTTGVKSSTENINDDDSSIYLCSSQKIPAILATSKKLKSLNYIYNSAFTDVNVDATADSTAFIKPTILPPPDLMIYGDPGASGAISTYNTGQPDIDLCMQLLLAREGTILESMFDVNKWRSEHGSDKITLPNGKIIDLYGPKFVHNPNTPDVFYNEEPNNIKWWPWTWRDKENGILDFLYIGDIINSTYKPTSKGAKMWKIDYALEKEDKYPFVKNFFNNRLSTLYRDLPEYKDKAYLQNTKYWNMTLREIFKEEGRPLIRLITKEDAAADLARRMTTGFFPDAEGEVGNSAAWQAIGVGARAALVSIKYNYGNIGYSGTHGSPTPAQVAATTGNKYAVALYISRMTSGSPERHQVEAYVALNDAMPAGNVSSAILQPQIISAAAAAGYALT